jgi:hypothetical protein
MKKIIVIVLALLLLLPLFLQFSLFADEDFTTIYPNEEVEKQEVVPIEEANQAGKEGYILEEEKEDVKESEQGQEEEVETTETIIDESTRKTANIYFDLTLERGDQTAFGQFVPYTLTITPHIDSPRTQIIWNTPTTLEARPRHNDFVALESGQTYVFKGRIKPLREGSYDFSISVISWQHDTNYTNTIRDNVTFNRNLVLQPVSTHYQVLNILKFVLIGLVFIGLVIITIIVVKKYTQKAKKWLTPPS